jgi:hypothetical protein
VSVGVRARIRPPYRRPPGGLAAGGQQAGDRDRAVVQRSNSLCYVFLS